ncbi:MAG: ArgE/DapE family deacylase [Desulfarculaceae bacterium]|nr:ArgE/DapE family deacylase [Desulfarculaceae bacterium]MCF8074288.1 ArgE/DapE family deacylase [Desulfarculaceae bacterium]MCF8103356.1 ArgE/DapE family deacylase [Desulfarculaceae bacterium]MCF8117854.1 ArgE/DapE family deacylase [Desulfarculaceae bacterium]
MNSLEKKIIGEVDSLESEIVDFTARLVAQPSTLGNEAGVLEVMEQEMVKLGLTPQKVEIDPEVLAGHPGFGPVPWSYEGRYNVVAVRPADAEGGKSALFNGHLDVVSPEPLGRWNRDPFDPVVEDGWLYGRGGSDMKAGVAAMTYALQAVQKAGLGLSAPVTLEGVIEEECTGNGALACVVAGHDADAVLIPEPLGQSILTGQVGVCWFKVSLGGVPIHVLDTHGGVNAIEKCCLLIQALRVMEEEINAEPLPGLPQVVHPANFNVGVINGGDWPSTVPAMAEFHCRQGFMPGTSFDQIKAKVEQTIAAAAAADSWLAANPPVVEFYAFRSLGHRISRDMPAFNLLSDVKKDLVGSPAEEAFSTATTDLRAFVHYGKGQATCYGPEGENMHADNERVDIASIIHTAKTYALFLARWCGAVE